MIVNSNDNATSEGRMQNGGAGIGDMPVGFSFALGTNQAALTNFAKMTDSEKRQVLEAARSVQSKRGMQDFVDSIGNLSYREHMY